MPQDCDTLPELARLEAYFAEPQERHRAVIALPLTWPNIKNAEYEVIQRFCRAGETIGARFIVTDNDGYPVWSSDGRPVDGSRPVSSAEADFMISLHFETPRLRDLPSYYAIWQPVKFYFDFGYESSIRKLMSHTDALSCSADDADAHIRALMAAAGVLPEAPFPFLFHSPPEPYFAPAISAELRLFYVGINWERLGQSGKGRFHELLQMLDEADLVDIYGPRVFLGARPWEGFATYRGELPFDGISVVRALHRSGICFAMSSAPHQDSGVMSNRLFEGLAAGAAIIANPHPIIDKYFSDVVWQIDDTVSDEEIFFQVSTIIADIRADPEAANRRALIGQKRLGELFSLEKSLQALIDRHPSRQAARRARTLPVVPQAITVVAVHGGMEVGPVADLVADLRAQEGVDIHLVLACHRVFAAENGKAVLDEARAHLAGVALLTDLPTRSGAAAMPRSGAVLGAVRAQIETPFVALVRPGERLFTEHFGALARRLCDDTGALAAVSEVLVETMEGPLARRRLGEPDDLSPAGLIARLGAFAAGRALFRRAVLDRLNSDTLSLLDGGEVELMLILAQENAALLQSRLYSCVCGELQELPQAVVARQFLRDCLPKAMAALLPTAVAPSAAVPRGAEYVPRLFLDTVIPTRRGSTAQNYLRAGFSKLEAEHVWIDGLSAALTFRLADATRDDRRTLSLRLNLSGRRERLTGRPQHCTIAVNGTVLAYVRLDEAPQWIETPLPLGITAAEVLDVRLTADHAEQVYGANNTVVDPRRLGIGLFGVEVAREREPEVIVLEPDMPYELARRGSGRNLLGAGCFVHDDMTWLTATPATLRFRLPRQQGVGRIRLRVMPVPSEEAYPPIELACRINDGPLETLRIVSPQLADYTVPITATAVGPGGFCALTITPSAAYRLAQGRRVLSVALQCLSLEWVEADAKPGADYPTTASGAGADFLGDGFSKPESGFTWIDGDRGSLSGRVLAASGARLRLVLRVGGRPVRGLPNAAEIWLCGRKIGDFAVPTSPAADTEVMADIPEGGLADGGAFTLELRLKRSAEAVTDANRAVVIDARRLGLNLGGFRFETVEDHT